MIQTKLKELINAKFDPNPTNVEHYIKELSSVFFTTMEKSPEAKSPTKPARFVIKNVDTSVMTVGKQNEQSINIGI